MAYGPALSAEYNVGQHIRLAEPVRSEICRLFPVTEPEAYRYLPPMMQVRMQQSSPKSFIEDVLYSRELINWGIYADDTLVGFTGVREDDYSTYTFVLARNSRRKGIGTRASRLMVAAVFASEPAAHSVCTVIHEDNVASLEMVSRKFQADDEGINKQANRKFRLPRPELADATLGGFAHALGETSLIEANWTTS